MKNNASLTLRKRIFQQTTLALLVVLSGCLPFELGKAVSLPDGSTPVNPGMAGSGPLAESVDERVLSYLEKHQLPGIGVGLIKEGAVVFSAGYGWADLEEEAPLMAHTPVLLSSVSKTFIGVAAMQAVEVGRLSLDDSLSDLAGFSVDNPNVAGERITLRHAVTHNTGIEDTAVYDDNYAPGDPVIPLGTFVAGYVTEGSLYWNPRNFADRPPGAAFSYSNVGAALGAFAIAKSADRAFRDLVAEDILQPLGMNDSAYFLTDVPRTPAVPYHPTGGGTYRPWPHYGYPTYPDGMLRASTDDMARYLAAVDGGGALGETRILSTQSVDTMLTIDPDAGSDENGQAVAWSVRVMQGRELFGHNGGDYGSSTEIWLDREARVGVVVLLNVEIRDWPALFQLQADLLDLAESAS